jgi:hypothetical protein
MRPLHWIGNLAIAMAIVATLAQQVNAQTQLRKGILLLNQVRTLTMRDSTISMGKLSDLQTDPNFEGNYQEVVNVASTILDGYTVVKRGGYFPENRGIPIKQQLTVAEVVYYLFKMPNGYELFLYRTPTENTAQYFIRKKS